MRQSCPDPEIVAAGAEGRLDSADLEQLLGHAADCDSCRRELAILQVLPEPAAVPDALQARTRRALLSAVDRERISRRIHSVRSAQRSFAWAAGVAAIAVLAISAYVLSRMAATGDPRPLAVQPSRPPSTPLPSPKADVALDSPPKPRIEVSPAPSPETPAIVEAPVPTPDLETPLPEPAPSPEPTIAAAPEATPSPSPEASPIDTVARAYDPVLVSDFTGEVSIRRAGRREIEKVSSFADVADGDVILTEKLTAFFMISDFPVALMPKTAVKVARERSSGALSLTLEAGEALVDSAAATGSTWLLSTGSVTVTVDRTRGKFAASIDGKSLALIALTEALSGHDDLGRSFSVASGERLTATAAGFATKPDGSAAKKREMLVASRPPDRTRFAFSPKAASLLEGKIETDGDNSFIRSAERKGMHSVKLEPKDARCHPGLVVRFRMFTNLKEVRVGLVVRDEIPLFTDVKIRKDQRRGWILVEAALTDFKTTGDEVNLTTQDRILLFSVTGRQMDVFGDDRGTILVDDLQFVERAPSEK